MIARYIRRLAPWIFLRADVMELAAGLRRGRPADVLDYIDAAWEWGAIAPMVSGVTLL